jgi:hypothetical protein
MTESHFDKKSSRDDKDSKKVMPVVGGAGVSTAILTKRLTSDPAKKLSSDLFSTYSKLSTLSFNKKLSRKDRETMDALRKAIVNLQKTVNQAQSDKTPALKKQFLAEKKSIEKLLNALPLEDKSRGRLRTKIKEDLKELDKCVTVITPFDDSRVHEATAFTKKKGGANPGYTITNRSKTRFTVKQGSTVGNTLSEVFSSMVLSKITRSDNAENESQTLIAHAFLVVKASENKDQKATTIEERCKESLYAASQWSSDQASFEACQLFGFKKRKKAAGTRQAEYFNELRQLNESYNLGLEKIIIPTALIADFDLHTENFMLKVNRGKVQDKDLEDFNRKVSYLKERMKATYPDTQSRIQAIGQAIKELQDLGASVYFHKIDHDSGFYRYADPERKVDFSTHRTAPVHLEGMKPKTQPTLHVTEITGGTKEGLDQLLLSDTGIDQLLGVTVQKESKIVLQTADEFMGMIHEKAAKIGAPKDEDKRAAEFYFLNEFYHHISSKKIKAKSTVVSTDDINEIKKEIRKDLVHGTYLKVKDLHEQVYQRLLEKENEEKKREKKEKKEEKKNPLNEKQLRLKSYLEEQHYPGSLIPLKDSANASSTPPTVLRH